MHIRMHYNNAKHSALSYAQTQKQTHTPNNTYCYFARREVFLTSTAKPKMEKKHT